MNTRLRTHMKINHVAFTIIMVLTLQACSVASDDASNGGEIPNWKARWELARTLSYAKKLDESIDQYKKLIKEKPDLTQAKAEMATVMFWQGKQNEALKILEQIPGEAMTPQAKLAAADLYAAKGKYDIAETLYREHLKTSPEDDKVRFRLAEMLSWAKRYDASIKEYETVLAIRPKDKQLRRKYALVLSWTGKHKQAAEELKKTLEEKDD